MDAHGPLAVLQGCLRRSRLHLQLHEPPYSTQPAIYGRARAWLAKCYIEQDWIYDAEDVIRNMRRDSIHWRAQKEWDYTLADYYIHTGDYAEAIPYLRKVIKHEMRKRQKAREYFLLGQLESQLGHKQEAYKAYKGGCTKPAVRGGVQCPHRNDGSDGSEPGKADDQPPEAHGSIG